MTKANILLKKAAFFEKLSLYGRREDFLKALAQGNPTATDANDANATAIHIINKVITEAQQLSGLWTHMPDTLPPKSNTDMIQATYNKIFSVLKPLSNDRNNENSRAATQLLTELSAVTVLINKAREWRDQQESIINNSQPGLAANIKGLYQSQEQSIQPNQSQLSTPQKTKFTVNTFQQIFDNLQFFYTTNNLKGMLNLNPKLEALLKQLGDNPYDDRIQKGSKLVHDVKQKLGEV